MESVKKAVPGETGSSNPQAGPKSDRGKCSENHKSDQFRDQRLPTGHDCKQIVIRPDHDQDDRIEDALSIEANDASEECHGNGQDEAGDSWQRTHSNSTIT